MSTPTPSSALPRPLALLAAFLLVPACGGGGGGGSGGTPPQALTYLRDFDLVARGRTLAANVPSVSGGAVTAWSVTPALPAGIELDPVTGVLSGVASSLAPLESYTVRASNAAGFAEFEVELGVVAPAETLVTSQLGDDTLSSYSIEPSSGWLAPTGYSLPPSGSKAPRSVVAHPSGRFVFVAQRATHSVSVVAHDLTTGRLREITAVPTAGKDPTQVLLSTDGSRLHVICQNTTHVETFAVAPDGGLGPVGSLVLEDGCWAGELSPDERFLWVTNVSSSTVRAVTFDGSGRPAFAGAAVNTGLAPTDASVSRDGRFLYVNCQLGNRIDVYSLDSVDGTPSRAQFVSAGTQPVALALAPSGKFLYASSSVDSLLRTYSVARDSGRLTELAVTPTGSRPSLLAFDPTGTRLYNLASDADEIEIYMADPSQGTLTRSESVRTRDLPLGLALLSSDTPTAPSSRFAYVPTTDADDVAVFQVDPHSGSLANVVDPLPSTGQPQDLAVHPSLAWVFATRADDAELALFSVDPISGALQPHGPSIATSSEPVAVEADPSGARVHVLCRAGSVLETFTFDALTGTLAYLSGAAVPPGSDSLTIDPTGRFLYVGRRNAGRIEVFTSDLATGALLHGSGFDVAGEPSDLAVMPNGRYLLATSAASDELTLMNLSSLDGGLSTAAVRATGDTPLSVTTDPVGRFVYVVSRDTAATGDVTTFRFAPNALLSGFLAHAGSIGAGVHPIAVRADATGSFLYVASETSRDVTRLSIDRATGLLSNPEATAMGATPGGLALRSTRR